jgi:hypothetical protein
VMIALENEIFDDLLIGNFMKTIIHGKFPRFILYPDFSPYVRKICGPWSGEIKRSTPSLFQRSYITRAPLEYFRLRVERSAANLVRFSLDEGSEVLRVMGRFKPEADQTKRRAASL